MRALVDVVVVDQGGVVQDLHRGRQLRRLQRLVALAHLRRQLHQPRPDPLAARLHQPPHRRRHRLRVDLQLARQLQVQQLVLHDEIAIQLHRQLAVARSVQLDREDRLPAAQHEVSVLYEHRREPRQQQLAAVSVTIHRLVDRDVDAPREIVVRVAHVVRGDPLQHRREVAQQQRLVLVDGQAERGVQRLQVHAARREAGALHLLPDLVGEVDELGRACALKAQAARDHRLLLRPQRLDEKVSY